MQTESKSGLTRGACIALAKAFGDEVPRLLCLLIHLQYTPGVHVTEETVLRLAEDALRGSDAPVTPGPARLAYARRLGTSLLVFNCPLCHGVHSHATTGGDRLTVAPCGRGIYRVVELAESEEVSLAG